MGILSRLTGCILLVLTFLLPEACFTQEAKEEFIQFFIKAPEVCLSGKPAKVSVYALDKQGLIAKDYEGRKEVSFEIEEELGELANSYSGLPAALDFIKGSANFLLSDTEAEVLKIKIREGSHLSPFPAKIAFKFPEQPVAFQLNLPKTGILNKPKEAEVLALDKDGQIATSYSATGVSITVEEEGIKDKSFSLKPQELAFKEGKAIFSIVDSEEKEELVLVVSDPSNSIKTAESRIIFDAEDTAPPRILELKMETLAFVELTFSEELEVASATDPYNYEVVCFSTQHPRNVELHKEKVILELDEMLRPYDQMHVSVKNIKDLAGNIIQANSSSPNYAVPKIPLRLEFSLSANPGAINSAITIQLTARCISGRIPQFVNGKFKIEVVEGVADGSFTLSSPEAQMVKGQGVFTISDSIAEKLTLTIKDPSGMVDPASLELNFI